MPSQYKTPGVYVLEENAFGSSIVANATAIPVLMGFTEKATSTNGEPLELIKGSSNVRVPVLINSVFEYNQHFGGPDNSGTINVTGIEKDRKTYYSAENTKDEEPFTPGWIAPSVSNYFANGGGNCYIISLGAYEDFDETNPDQVEMEYILKAIEMAEQATLIAPTDLLRYGRTSYYQWTNRFLEYCYEVKTLFTVVDVVMNDPNSSVLNMDDVTNYRNEVNVANPKYAGAYYPYLKSLTPYSYKEDLSNVTLDGEPLDPEKLGNAIVQDIKSFLDANYINMPASPFMVGIYSRIDNSSGVWTPPANVSPIGISGPVVNLTSNQQEDFNVDPTTGKSINAIRSFTGKGTLVWGARTNDGNSMDWRYVNVVRLFISMETDISKALEAFVFKPNVHNTWVEVKTMINSYLFGLYQDGAFAGTTPETSYQVQCGVGATMTDEDVLNGYMRVSIQVAPVRPAEFIVLTFSQMVGQ